MKLGWEMSVSAAGWPLRLYFEPCGSGRSVPACCPVLWMLRRNPPVKTNPRERRGRLRPRGPAEPARGARARCRLPLCQETAFRPQVPAGSLQVYSPRQPPQSEGFWQGRRWMPRHECCRGGREVEAVPAVVFRLKLTAQGKACPN